MPDRTSASERLREKLASYASIDKAREWLDRNRLRVRQLYQNVRLRDFIFEPIKEVFEVRGDSGAGEIRQIITLVAVANAVMAGLPGKMGVGVFVSIGLEGWMAYTIASRVGIVLGKVSDVWKYFGLLAAVAGVILYGVRIALGLVFSLLTPLPGISAMVPAELVVTNLMGILFWTGFQEARSKGSFSVPLRALKHIGQETKELTTFQWHILRNNLSASNLKLIGMRLRAWLRGEIALDNPTLRGEIAPTVLMAYVLKGHYEELQGPMGQEFLEAIRDRWPELHDASISEIAANMSEYDAAQLTGVISEIKGKLFERLVTVEENSDNDHWHAVMHTDETYPGSDLILTNDETGHVVELSLKATDSPSYVEHALMQYPDIPILTTHELGEHFAHDPHVIVDHFTDKDLTDVTQEKFDALVDHLTSCHIVEGAASGVVSRAIIQLWPFVVAFARRHISQEQLNQAFSKVLGNSGTVLAARVGYAALLGPLFGWYLLARGVMALTRKAHSTGAPRVGKRLVAKVQPRIGDAPDASVVET